MTMKQRISALVEALEEPIALARLIGLLEAMAVTGDGGGMNAELLLDAATRRQVGPMGPTISRLRLQRVIDKQCEPLTVGDLISRLSLLRAIEIGIAQADQGLGIDHDELFDELLNDEKAKGSPRVVPVGEGQTQGNQGLHRSAGSKNGSRVHRKNKRLRKEA